MDKLRAIFWNADERRVRALWRLLLHGLLVVLLGLIGSVMLMTIVPGLLESAWSWPIYALMSALAVAGAGAAAGRTLDRRRFVDFGLRLDRRWWLDFMVGIGIGAVLMAGIFAVELGAGLITIDDTFVSPQTDVPFAVALLGPWVLFVAVGFYEEKLFRGYHLRNLAEGFAPRDGSDYGRRRALVFATLLSSAEFGFVHATNPGASVTSSVAVMLAGCMLALGLLWTGELALPIGLHLSWNFCQGNVFGFAVSGNDVGPRMIAITQVGDPVLTGGDFGPEAGLVGIAAMIVGAGLTAAWVRVSRGRVELHTELTRWQPTES